MSARPNRGPGRGLVAAAVLLAALLVVVALASRGQLGADGSGSGAPRPALPGGVFAYVYAALLVTGLLALPFFFYMYAKETPYSKTRRRRARLAPLVLVAFVFVGLLLATRFSDELGAALAQLREWRGDRGPPGNGDGAATPPAPEWVPMLLVSSALLVAAGGLLVWRRVKRRGSLRRLSLAETLSDALEDTLGDLRAERDARRAIILAYAGMEAALERSGVPRREPEAPLEYLSRVLLELDVTAAPVRTLTDLFEHAKFSHHAVDAAMKQRAIEALETIRAELRGPV